MLPIEKKDCDNNPFGQLHGLKTKPNCMTVMNIDNDDTTLNSKM